jgi:hypothetical protein
MHPLQALQILTSNPTPFEWASQHLHLIGWPALVVIAWKAANVFRKFVDRLEKTTTQIDTMATNHFPHMEASLASQDRLMESMDTSLREIASNTGRRRGTDYPVDGNRA